MGVNGHGRAQVWMRPAAQGMKSRARRKEPRGEGAMSSVSRSGPSRAKPAHQRSQTWVQPGLTRTAAAQLPPLDRPVPSCWDHVKALVQGAEEEELGPAEGADQQGGDSHAHGRYSHSCSKCMSGNMNPLQGQEVSLLSSTKKAVLILHKIIVASCSCRPSPNESMHSCGCMSCSSSIANAHLGS